MFQVSQNKGKFNEIALISALDTIIKRRSHEGARSWPYHFAWILDAIARKQVQLKGQAQQLLVPHPPSIKMENSCKTELANGSAAIASRDQFRLMSDVCGNALSSAPFVEDF